MLNKKIVLIIVISAIIITFFSLRWYQKTTTVLPETNSLIVGTAAEFPPFEFIENGVITGFDIDLIEEVAKRMGKQLKIHDTPFTTLIPQLQMGSIQLIAAGLTPTKERAEQVLFSENYTAGDQLVIVTLAHKQPLTTIDALKCKEVIVNDGFSAEAYLSSIPEILLKRLPTVADAFLALTTERADAFVTAFTTVKPFFDQYGSEHFTISPLEGTSEPAAFAISKKHPELVTRINAVLHEMHEDGSLEALKRKWHLL